MRAIRLALVEEFRRIQKPPCRHFAPYVLVSKDKVLSVSVKSGLTEKKHSTLLACGSYSIW